MKVLAILGTMRKKGDSYHVIQMFEERINRIEPVEFQYLYLSDTGLDYCLGCCNCISIGEEMCAKRRLTAEIETEMLNADGIVLASPVYAHQVTALMKNFMDHFAYFFHRPRFFDKAAVVLSPTGGSGLKETLGYLKFTAAGWGFWVVGTLGVISSFFRTDESYQSKITGEIDRIALRMLHFMKTKKRPGPTFYELMFFRGMRFKAKYNPCDRKYWEERDWFSKNYYVDGPVNPVKLISVNILEKMVGFLYGQMMRNKKV